ncbi:M10 family metallopeptidase [Roseivivax jejudonensis]|nr:M10 family metallopeptidase [Roseivivax jejudonensis]
MRDAATGAAVTYPTIGGTAGILASDEAVGTTTEQGDAASGRGTSASLDVGEIFQGEIDRNDASDWMAVDLEAGESYVFLAWGTGGSSDGLDDTMLTLRNGGGSEIASNDDMGGGNLFSAIEYTAQSSGTYYVDVSGASGERGEYKVIASPAEASIETAAIYLSEIEWGAPTPIRFENTNISVDLSGLTSQAQQLARWALDAWEEVSPLRFTETTRSADIVFDDNSSGAFAGPSYYYLDSGINEKSNVNVSTSWTDQYGTSRDSYSFETFVHEIGHALGLGHLGPYSGSIDFDTDALFANDSTLLSVMSYFEPDENPNVPADDVTALTPMLADIAAIQKLYGGTTAHTGNTTWGANSNVGGALGTAFAILYDGASAPGGFWDDGKVTYTIFDTGGIDKIDLSTVGVSQELHLGAGSVSDVGGIKGGLAIAAGTVIENAATGAGNDLIVGNNANNQLQGGRGNDTIYGGLGTDTAIFGVTLASATAVAEGQGVRITSDAGNDYLEGVERFAFTDGTVTRAQLLEQSQPEPEPQPQPKPEPEPEPTPSRPGSLVAGTEGNDTLTGTGNDDTLAGGEGSDSLIAGGGHDQIAGSDGNDTIRAGAGNDNIGGGTGRDSIDAGDGNDTVGGGFDEDSIFGGHGHDVLAGGAGEDILRGGTGDDTAGASYGHDELYGNAGDDSLGGGFGRDTINGDGGNDDIGGGEGNDVIDGGSGNDFVAGGGRHDVVRGGDGNDRLNGGEGNDTLTGGNGADMFLFNDMIEGERDIITDFELGFDSMRISGVENAPGSGLAGYLDALDPRDTADGAVLSFNGHEILLAGVDADDLDLGDFVFV